LCGALVVTLAMLLRLINCRFIIIIITSPFSSPVQNAPARDPLVKSLDVYSLIRPPCVAAGRSWVVRFLVTGIGPSVLSSVRPSVSCCVPALTITCMKRGRFLVGHISSSFIYRRVR